MAKITASKKMPLSLDSVADSLKTNDINTLLQRISKNIQTHANDVGRNDHPTILTSRFMSAQQAYDEGIISCGTIANISAEMLKHLGYKVKLVHGAIPSTPTHAWISIKDDITGRWQQYDLTKKDAQITKDHREEYIVDDWSEIKDFIESIYYNNHQSRDL